MRKDKRQARFLEALTSTIKRKKFCVVDIESKEDDTQKAGFTRPFLVGTYDPTRDVYQEFRNEHHLRGRAWEDRAVSPGGCVDKFLNYILSAPFAGFNIYAHFGGGFDHLFWLRWLKEHIDEFGFEIVPVQSSIQVIRVWRRPEDPDETPRDRWTFLDSFKLLPMGLEKACKTFGLPGKVAQDLHMEENDPSWGIYLKQDCVALAKVLEKTHDLIEDRLGGEVGMTTPATAMKLFRRKYMGRKNTVQRIERFAHWPDCKSKKCLGCAHAWVRRGYYGGRTEVFLSSGKNLRYYDYNSSYVAAMCEPMPVGERVICDGTLDWNMDDAHAGFAEVTVEIPETCHIPPLPYRDPETGKLIFPVGVFKGVWSTEELKLLYEPSVKGRIVAVGRVVWFRRQEVFGEMMRDLYMLRDKSLPGYDEGLSALGKLLGNALYGKFGMREERQQIVFRHDVGEERLCILCKGKLPESMVEDEPAVASEPELSVSGICEECEGSKPATGENDLDADVWYQTKKVTASYIIPHVSAHITALARVRLWKGMQVVVLAGYNVAYCDTDSQLTDMILHSSTALGELKDEYPGETLTGEFIRPKVYMIERTEKNERESALYQKQLELLTGDEDCDASTLGDLKLEKAKVTMKGFPPNMRTKENLRRLQAGETLDWKNLQKVRTLARAEFDHGPKMIKVEKSFQGDYDKRILLSDGTSRPIVLTLAESQDALESETDQAAAE